MATTSIVSTEHKIPRSGIAESDAVVAKRVHNTVLLLMGVSGCGKSTVALELQRLLGWEFKEGTICIRPRTSRRCDLAIR